LAVSAAKNSTIASPSASSPLSKVAMIDMWLSVIWSKMRTRMAGRKAHPNGNVR